MKSFQSLLPVFGLVAAAQAWASDWNQTQVTTTTITTDIYTTYCPEATTFTQGTKTYTATASETITITDCPCTFVSTPTWAPSKPSTTVIVPPIWTTTIITTDVYTTYCPEATTFTQGTKTYTATASETVTITDCPCTIETSSTCPPTSTPTWYPPPPLKNATSTLPPVWITTTVSEYTTYCPTPTVISHGNHTWSVTSPTTLTISECPCTISYTISSETSTPVPTYPGGVASGTGHVAPTKTPVGPSASITGPLQATGAAKKFEAGVGVIAAAGLVALLL